MELVKKNEKYNFIIFIIVDECHRSGSELNSTALQGPWCATLGISATPEREYDDGFESKISPALGEVLYSYDYKQAMQDGESCGNR